MASKVNSSGSSGTSFAYAENQLTVTDPRISNSSARGDFKTVCIAVAICTFLKRHPNYMTLEERLNVETILGSKCSQLAEQIMNRITSETESERPQKDVMYSYELSLLKCETLKALILSHPFIMVASNASCRDLGGTTLLARVVTFELSQALIAGVAAEKLAAIQARITSLSVKICIISQSGWDQLQGTILKLRGISNQPLDGSYATHGQAHQPLDGSYATHGQAQYGTASSSYQGSAQVFYPRRDDQCSCCAII